MSWWKVVIGVLIVVGFGWGGWYVTRPVPGTQMADQGRDHVTGDQVATFTYNSNPPTSGPPLATWVKSGVYDKPQSEGELIHSLEHGYVIINYNCNVHLKIQSSKFKVQNVYAHEESASAGAASFAEVATKAESADKAGEASPTADLVRPVVATASAVNESDGCKTVVKELEDLARKKKLFKLIVVPRPQLDTTIALAAWTYIDKFDAPALPAGRFDAGRIERFIDYHRDQGPEKTME